MSQTELTLRDDTLATHERNRSEDLATIRRALRHQCLGMRIMGIDPVVSANDVRRIIADYRIPPGNWLGSVFKHREWVCTGRSIKSTTPGRHGSRIMTWRLRDG